MEQPQGFWHPQFLGHACQLRKSLYGLKQVLSKWFHKLTSQLVKLGFCGPNTDSSLFFNLARPLYILIYVDDILVLGPPSMQIPHLISSLRSVFVLKDLGPASNFLGIKFRRHQNGYLLSQASYIASILCSLWTEDCKPLPTPNLTSCSTNKHKVLEEPHVYHRIVGAVP